MERVSGDRGVGTGECGYRGVWVQVRCEVGMLGKGTEEGGALRMKGNKAVLETKG